ncbi:BTAD domain-containing putative transcriptional regulator [Microtetraspora malaysiensis]|uniref:AfsR/SARP family transcriptional regulator n=1 Tax=Microtetraspora malaysiensis TaxID=161358 RepID=UPI003D8C409C
MSMSQIMFTLLGPLEVRADGRALKLGSPRQRTILTMLLLAPNRVVSVDSLIEAVWPHGAPTTARNQIAICVVGLRKVFKDAVGAVDLIVTSHPGYILNSLDHRIDVVDFEERVAQARDAASAGRTAEACDLFAEAITLWRGRALDGVTGSRIEEEAARLEEARLDAYEQHAGLQIQLGRHHALLPELSALVKEHPLREQSRAHLMLAHYRSGRRAEALAAFREGRDLLVEELGIEPGPVLQGLHDLVLRDSPELTQPPANPVPTPSTNVPAQLPVDSASFTGRAGELRALDQMLDERLGQSPLAVAAISGVGGVGKTALAIHWANQVAGRFPDGQLFTDLRGYDEKDYPASPAAVLDRFLRALGVAGPQIPADLDNRAALYRSVLSGKRVLIVLDNARSFQQIRPLLPGSGRCCVLITGRDVIDDLIGDYALLQIGLNVMAPDEAAALLAEVAGEARIGADPTATARLGALCDQLPLALRIAGARLAAKPHWSVRSLVSRLENQRRRLDELSPREGGVRASFRLSYRDLPPAAQRLYRRLGLLTVPDFAAWVGAALLDITDPVEAENLLEQLVDAHLLEVAWGSGPATRYRFLDLLRLFSWECAQAEEGEGERAAAMERAYSGWLALADAARQRTYGGNHSVVYGPVQRFPLPEDLVDELLEDPMAWLESERTAITDVIHQAAESNHSAYAWGLTVSGTTLFEAHNYLEDWHSCAMSALAAARRVGDRLGEATMLRSLGTLAIYQRKYREAQSSLLLALKLFEECGEVHGRAVVLRNLALCSRFAGDLGAARREAGQSLKDFRKAEDLAGESHVLGLLAQIELEIGNVPGGIALCREAIAKSREAGSMRGEMQNTYRLAEALMRQGDPAAAERACFEVLALTRAESDRLGQGHALRGIGEARWRLGDPEGAEPVLRQALEVAEEVADRFLQARIQADLGCARLVGGELRAAVELLRSALEVFEELEAQTWRQRMVRILDAVDADRDPDASGLRPTTPAGDLVVLMES